MASGEQLSYEDRLKLVTQKVEQIRIEEKSKAEPSTGSTVAVQQPQYIEITTVPLTIVAGLIGFILGVIMTAFVLSIKIKHIKFQCKTQVEEARAALDRTIMITSQK